jgi:hypothetical protein
MKTFLDTSSLIKLYHQEEGSDFVMKALSNDIAEIFLTLKSEKCVFLTSDRLLRSLFEKEKLNIL